MSYVHIRTAANRNVYTTLILPHNIMHNILIYRCQKCRLKIHTLAFGNTQTTNTQSAALTDVTILCRNIIMVYCKSGNSREHVILTSMSKANYSIAIVFAIGLIALRRSSHQTSRLYSNIFGPNSNTSY